MLRIDSRLVAWTLLFVYGPFIHTSLAEKLELVRKIPHTGYSEGLDYFKGYLWNAKPDQIVKIDPSDGRVIQAFKPATQYSESVMWFKGELWNLSYSDNGIYVGHLKGDKLVFQRKGSTPESTGWGIANDGKNIIVTGSHNSSKIYFLDPVKLSVVRTIETPVKDIEDLAWDGKALWSSSFTSHRGQIFRIDPTTGAVSQFLSLPDPEECPVIDGIAFDGKFLWITGKNCGSILCVKLPGGKK